jgi:hypothetical protein
MSEENAERARLREAVEPHLGGEKLEAVGVFTRPFEPGATGGLTEASLAWNLIHRLVTLFTRRDQGPLGILPKRFLLVVTTSKVHALSYRDGGSSDPWLPALPPGQSAVKERIATFDRKAVSFSEGMGTWGNVAVLELTEEGERCSIDVKKDALDREKNPWAAEVVALLQRSQSEAAGLRE